MFGIQFSVSMMTIVLLIWTIEIKLTVVSFVSGTALNLCHSAVYFGEHLRAIILYDIDYNLRFVSIGTYIKIADLN